ncbi:MAG: nuclear transport factor 2 family protein [Acidimicrobiales bacterium]|nr:nuclear transport factor 2 family protein [Acidimicrobiales bacterium]
MGTNESRAAVDRIVDAYNAKDLEALSSLYHPDATYWSALSDLREGRDSIRNHIQELFTALPDERMRAKVVIAEGDTAVVEFESTGRGVGGVEYRVEFTEVIKFDQGRISSVNVYIDPEAVEGLVGNH